MDDICGVNSLNELWNVELIGSDDEELVKNELMILKEKYMEYARHQESYELLRFLFNCQLPHTIIAAFFIHLIGLEGLQLFEEYLQNNERSLDVIKCVLSAVRLEDLSESIAILGIAVQKNDLEVVALILDATTPEFREQKYEDLTVLYVAVRRGDEAMVECLLKGSRPEFREVQSSSGATILHVAVELNNANILSMLLDGSNPEFREIEARGRNALYAGAFFGYPCNARLLLKDAHPDYRYMSSLENGSNALHVACLYGHIGYAKELLNECRPEYYECLRTYNSVNPQSQSPLFAATLFCRSIELVTILLKGCRDEFRKDPIGSIHPILVNAPKRLPLEEYFPYFELLIEGHGWGHILESGGANEEIMKNLADCLTFMWEDQCTEILFCVNQFNDASDDELIWGADGIVRNTIKWIDTKQ
eukprot:TRINITY_DN354_c0_g1_i1.p1 TRINITY_DN354_c0_g1~~TRINITY_DN354_c0_g1_i1.p1  ORF type:complete len:421 (-),score=51.50 TRINITY_DN354_c0_g1_i1:90-1352(-)